MALSSGSLAPNIVLKQKTANGLQDVRLADHFGHDAVVLLFFPLAFTSVCTQEMCTVTEDFAAYQALGAKVYAISVDSPFAQEAWAEQNKIKVPVLSDFNREAIRAYEVVCPELVGLKDVALRSAFVINKSGVIVYSWVANVPKDLPDFEAIKKAL